MIELDYILPKVQKAARYSGGELGSVVKKLPVDIRFAFCFPDVYEVGMSHLGMKILYHMMNERDDVWVERVFAPWEDMENIMREKKIPLFGLESRDPIKDFDFIGFTLQYEMSYTNVLNMLQLAGVPLESQQRTETMPFVCAGGPCAFNPEPLAMFIDFFLIGEGEEIWQEVLDEYKVWKAGGGSRERFLERIAAIEGIYVPAFYDVQYHEDGTLKSMRPNRPGVPERVKKRIISDLDSCYYPERMIVPFMEIVHDRITLEVFRGCIRGCRFCQAGMVYRPLRQKSPKRLLELAEKLIQNTGYEEVSLCSLSTSDYQNLPEFMDGLLAISEDQKVNLALPSLRVDNFSIDLMQRVQKVRKSGLTFAPEAGTQRMRDVINKGVEEEDLLRSARLAFEGGWHNVKLYFMIGLPTETEEDVAGIAQLAQKVVEVYYGSNVPNKGKRFQVTISVSSFVPKPFTPFQWEPQDTIDSLRKKQQYLKEKITSKKIAYHYHVSYVSSLEGVFARGDRRVGQVLKKAHELGCKFDSWDEYFHYDRWVKAFQEVGLDPEFYANRRRSVDEILPWDVIDCGVSKQFFIREKERAYQGIVTPNCREGCSGCGAAGFFEDGVCSVLRDGGKSK